jgi:hypothetical protein
LQVGRTHRPNGECPTRRQHRQHSYPTQTPLWQTLVLDLPAAWPDIHLHRVVLDCLGKETSSSSTLLCKLPQLPFINTRILMLICPVQSLAGKEHKAYTRKPFGLTPSSPYPLVADRLLACLEHRSGLLAPDSVTFHPPRSA